MKLVMGIDVGTTAIKVIVLRVKTKSSFDIVKVASISHDLISTQHGWAEEDANVWRENLYSILSSLSKEIDFSFLDSISVTGMVPALILLDEKCRPLRYSIQQNDMRSEKEIEYLKEKLEKDDSYFLLTGSHVNSQHIAPRLLWLKNHESEIVSQVTHILGSYDYIRFLLTGNIFTEYNWALESGLYSLEGQLLEDVFSLTGCDKKILPPVIKSYEEAGVISKEASAMTGLPEGIKVYAGTADHVASAFATGARENGDLVLKLGGAGDILLSLDHLVLDDRLFIDYFCSSHCPFVLNGCTAASGSLIKWFKNEFGGDFEELDKKAGTISAGSAGLVVLPYVLGEKTPIFDPNAKGVIFGLKLSHTKAHIYRAILESVAYAFRHHVDVFKEAGIVIKTVYITNGGSTSPLWRQIMADVLGCEVNYIEKNPGSCIGAAFIAGIANNVFDEDVILDFVSQKKISYPNRKNKDIYDERYYVYRKLYPALKDLF